MSDFLRAARAIAADRERGASALVAELLPVLDEAVAAGQSAVVEVARVVCRGQPAMASLWNLCAAALAECSDPGRYARRRAEVGRARLALVRAATLALRDALQGSTAARILTVSHSGSVARTLVAAASERRVTVICTESLPGGEGRALAATLREAGLAVECVVDALATTFLSSVDAVVVGADTLAAHSWTNKAGTFGVAAAAWFAAVPVYVVASRDKAAPPALAARLQTPSAFERTPAELATLFLTDIGPVAPDHLAQFVGHAAADPSHLLTIL